MLLLQDIKMFLYVLYEVSAAISATKVPIIIIILFLYICGGFFFLSTPTKIGRPIAHNYDLRDYFTKVWILEMFSVYERMLYITRYSNYKYNRF